MGGMVSTVLLVVIAVVVGLLVLLVIYLVDRFNALERDTQVILRDLEKARASPQNAGPFAGLSGKRLWDTLTGAAPPEVDEMTLDMVRERYRAVLQQHVTHIFKEGVSDGRNGFDAPPSNTRNIKTLRGQVESWLPASAIGEIYRAGQAFFRNDPVQLPAARQALDAAYAQLHTQCGLEPLQPASSFLMVASAQEEGADAAAPGAPPAPPPAAGPA